MRVVEDEVRDADGARPSLEVTVGVLVFVPRGIESHRRVLPGSLWLLQHGEWMEGATVEEKLLGRVRDRPGGAC